MIYHNHRTGKTSFSFINCNCSCCLRGDFENCMIYEPMVITVNFYDETKNERKKTQELLEVIGDDERITSEDIQAESNQVSSDEEILTFESVNSYDMAPLVWDVTLGEQEKSETSVVSVPSSTNSTDNLQQFDVVIDVAAVNSSPATQKEGKFIIIRTKLYLYDSRR